MHYVSKIPKTIPAGKVLVHNHLSQVTPSLRPGTRGFRAWVADRSKKYERCDCGWAGLEHYRVKAIRERREHLAAETSREKKGRRL